MDIQTRYIIEILIMCRKTSAGLTTAAWLLQPEFPPVLDISLHLVEKLCGRDAALKTARQMEYVWNGYFFTTWRSSHGNRRN